MSAPDIISTPAPLYTYFVSPITKTCNMIPIKSASSNTEVTGRIFFILLYYIKKMDWQGIGIFLALILIGGGMVYSVVSRSKKSGYAIEEKY